MVEANSLAYCVHFRNKIISYVYKQKKEPEVCSPSTTWLRKTLPIPSGGWSRAVPDPSWHHRSWKLIYGQPIDTSGVVTPANRRMVLCCAIGVPGLVVPGLVVPGLVVPGLVVPGLADSCRTGNFCEHNLCILVCDIIFQKYIFAFHVASV